MNYTTVIMPFLKLSNARLLGWTCHILERHSFIGSSSKNDSCTLSFDAIVFQNRCVLNTCLFHFFWEDSKLNHFLIVHTLHVIGSFKCRLHIHQISKKLNFKLNSECRMTLY